MSAKITEAMVEALAKVLLGRVNAPEQEIYRAARDGLAAALSTEPGEARGKWVADREMLAEAAEDPFLSDGAVRALCIARRGKITPEIRQWALENLAGRTALEDKP